MGVRVLFIGSTLLLTALVTGASASGGSVGVERIGYWSLGRLHSRTLELRPGGDGAGQASVSFKLPPVARQGPELWYLVRLHATVQLKESSGRGAVYVEAAVNGRNVDQIEVQVRHSKRCSQRLKWSTVDLVSGHRAGVVCGDKVDVKTTNFSQIRSIRGGVNQLNFRVERFGNVDVGVVRVWADSGIVVSRRGQALIRFKPISQKEAVIAGMSMDVPFFLRNDGDRPARQVAVLLAPTGGEGIVPVGPSMYNFRRIGPGRKVSGTFRLKAKRPGRQELTLLASSTANRPAIGYTVNVGRRGAGDGYGIERIAYLLGGLCTAGAGLVILARDYRRRRRVSESSSE
jgi:hypothetical protein